MSGICSCVFQLWSSSRGVLFYKKKKKKKKNKRGNVGAVSTAADLLTDKGDNGTPLEQQAGSREN